MPIHDWTRVDAGIFHFFHQAWIIAIADALNRGLLPADYYALGEQHGARFEPDVLALKADGPPDREDGADLPNGRAGGGDAGGLLVAEPQVRVRAETDLEFYRRKQDVVAIRHVSGDRLVAIVEIISKGNKSGRKAFDDFIKKAGEFLGRGVHLLILDLQPPTPRDPEGIHGVIWEDVADQEYARPLDKPLTLVSYDAESGLRAFIEPVAVGDPLIDMPLFLERHRYVLIPVEATYRTAYESVPGRLRAILDRP